MSDDKILDKLQKIKRHMDSAKEIGNIAEAEVFAGVLQKLLLKHKLDMSDIEFETFEKEQPVAEYFVNWRKHDIKPKRQRIKWVETLASVIAKAHFCRILVHPKSNFITLVGRHEDAAVAEFMLVTLYRAADKMSEKADYHHRLECKRERREIGHGFRESWLAAFVTRLMNRYQEERGSHRESTMLVRINRAEKSVEDFIRQGQENKEIGKKSTALKSSGVYHAEGYRQGHAAAEKIDLRTNAIDAKNASRREVVGAK